MTGAYKSPVRLVEVPKLHKLRDEAMLRASLVVRSCPVAHEWAELTPQVRMVLLLLSGVDGEIECVAGKDWREFTELERRAIQSNIRLLRRQLDNVNALLRS